MKICLKLAALFALKAEEVILPLPYQYIAPARFAVFDVKLQRTILKSEGYNPKDIAPPLSNAILDVKVESEMEPLFPSQYTAPEEFAMLDTKSQPLILPSI